MLGRYDIRTRRYCDAIGDVQSMSRHANIKLSRQLRRTCHSNLVDVGKCEMAPAPRERHRDRTPDPGCSTRDDSRSTCETHALSHRQSPS
jgi:hypothetical protein